MSTNAMASLIRPRSSRSKILPYHSSASSISPTSSATWLMPTSLATLARYPCGLFSRSGLAERGVQIDVHAARVLQQGIALAPECIPRLLLALEPCFRHAGVDLVDLGGALALESEGD